MSNLETVNDDANTKVQVPTEKLKKSSPDEQTGFKSSRSRMFLKIGVLKNL